mgnify:CR=1 FL=1
MVSCTLTFRKAEAADVPRVIEAFTGRLKVVSFLPVSEHGYLQAPYIPCTEAEYNAAVNAITGGSTVTVEDNYIRESVLEPHARAQVEVFGGSHLKLPCGWGSSWRTRPPSPHRTRAP